MKVWIVWAEAADQYTAPDLVSVCATEEIANRELAAIQAQRNKKGYPHWVEEQEVIDS